MAGHCVRVLAFGLGLLCATSVLAQGGDAWSTVGTTPERPALTFSRDGTPLLVMMCEGISMSFQVRGFTLQQSFPQPELAIAVKDARRGKHPDTRMIGDQAALETTYPIADSVLDAIAAGGSIEAVFAGQSQVFPSPPEGMRTGFSAGCAALVPAGMRRS